MVAADVVLLSLETAGLLGGLFVTLSLSINTDFFASLFAIASSIDCAEGVSNKSNCLSLVGLSFFLVLSFVNKLGILKVNDGKIIGPTSKYSEKIVIVTNTTHVPSLATRKLTTPYNIAPKIPACAGKDSLKINSARDK